MGTVYAEDSEPYPNQMYLFIMDAAPKSLRAASAATRDEEARVRAVTWIQWHLDLVRVYTIVEWLPPKECAHRDGIVGVPVSFLPERRHPWCIHLCTPREHIFRRWVFATLFSSACCHPCLCGLVVLDASGA